jgi:hypothetical protein
MYYIHVSVTSAITELKFYQVLATIDLVAFEFVVTDSELPFNAKLFQQIKQVQSSLVNNLHTLAKIPDDMSQQVIREIVDKFQHLLTTFCFEKNTYFYTYLETRKVCVIEQIPDGIQNWPLESVHHNSTSVQVQSVTIDMLRRNIYLNILCLCPIIALTSLPIDFFSTVQARKKWLQLDEQKFLLLKQMEDWFYSTVKSLYSVSFSKDGIIWLYHLKVEYCSLNEEIASKYSQWVRMSVELLTTKALISLICIVLLIEVVDPSTSIWIHIVFRFIFNY